MTLSCVLTCFLLLSPLQVLSLTTPSGPITGQIVDVPDGSSRRVQQFLSIPYALPPTGDRRFKPPHPVPTWSDPVLAYDWPASCPQVAVNSSEAGGVFNLITQPAEDCLYLNVWSPVPTPERAAVLVWIYGGGFITGSASSRIYDGRILSAHTNLIVVTLQYRVGALGFLSLGTPEAPGNVGLLDQRLALKWVKENIESFGGDPERITIFGESAGGASVSFHLLSEGSHSYFSRAIMESASFFSPWAYKPRDETISLALTFARSVGCGGDNLDEVAECLRGSNIDTVVRETGGFENFPSFVALDNDGEFLTDTVSNLLLGKSFKRTQILLGANRNEGSMFLPWFALEFMPNITDITLAEYTIIINRMFVQLTNSQRRAISFMYRDWDEPVSSPRLLASLEQALGDYWFLCPATALADLYAGENLPVYSYLFSQKSSFFPGPEWAGVMHTEELPSVFGLPLIADGSVPPTSTQEKDVSRMMMEYWRNFAETGNPSSDGSGQVAEGGVWPQRTPGERFLHLMGGRHPLPTGLGPRSHYCSFWYNYLPTLEELQLNGSGRHLTNEVCWLVVFITLLTKMSV